MLTIKEHHYFGYFDGLVYGHRKYSEPLDAYRGIRNTIARDAVLQHIENLSPWLAPITGSRADIIDGEEFKYVGPGRYEDGDFVFPTEFPHYYEKYNLGIPPEYEAYLKSIGVGQ